MAIQRKIRIDLSKYDTDWKGAYILIATRGFKEQIELERTMQKVQRKMLLIDRKIAKNDKAISKLVMADDYDEAELATLEAKEVELEKEADGKAYEVVDIIIDFVAKRFIEGKIFDGDTKALIDMKKEHFEELDLEVLRVIQGQLMGNIEKKD